MGYSPLVRVRCVHSRTSALDWTYSNSYSSSLWCGTFTSIVDLMVWLEDLRASSEHAQYQVDIPANSLPMDL